MISWRRRSATALLAALLTATLSACGEPGAGRGTGRIAAGINIPPLTAAQKRVTPGPTIKPGEPLVAALGRTGGQLLTCGAEKQSVVTSYQDVRCLIGGACEVTK